MDLKALTDIELGQLDLQVKAEIARRNKASTNLYWIDDSGRNKSRDTVESYWKVFPAKIIQKRDADKVWTFYVKKSDTAAYAWAQRTAEKCGWELIPQ